jgi:hypothetical protein
MKHRIIIAGSRDFTDYESVIRHTRYLTRNMEVNEIEIVSGCCPIGKLTFTRKDGTKVYGADGLGERYAQEKGYAVKLMPANWKQYGKSAGPIRNTEMAKYGTHCLVFWDGISRGSKDMSEKAEKFGLIGETIKPEPA